uniref:Uncharacterized protein n=1 Tax=mine drainage metagenome TaxID=410659 RepID=E6QHU9_9ZZZZ
MCWKSRWICRFWRSSRALRRGGENRKKPKIFRLLFSFSVFRLIFQVIENRLFILFLPG